jgi:hypothetical protein
MKVLIGVDPHKTPVTVAVLDEFVECATFPRNSSGLRTLERWAERFPERHWAVENAGGFGGAELRIRTLDRKIADLNERIESEVEASGTSPTVAEKRTFSPL